MKKKPNKQFWEGFGEKKNRIKNKEHTNIASQAKKSNMLLVLRLRLELLKDLSNRLSSMTYQFIWFCVTFFGIGRFVFGFLL